MAISLSLHHTFHAEPAWSRATTFPSIPHFRRGRVGSDDCLAPLPRLTARELAALAASLRAFGPADAEQRASVAAAIESVSRRRARHSLPGAALAALQGWRAFVALAPAAARGFAAALLGSNPWREAPDARISKRRTPASQARPLTSKRTVDLTEAALLAALEAVERGDGLLPDTCDALLRRNLVEWVDFESGLATDENSPRSLLRLTCLGRARFEAHELPLTTA